MNNKRYKVLIVEDDPKFSDPLKLRVQDDDMFEVLGVTDSSNEAYKLLKSGLPDVVIVDLQLTEGDGYELLEKIRNPSESLPIQPYVLVTTLFSSDMTMRVLADGLADYVFKKQNESYSPETILKHLHTVSRQFNRNCNPEPQKIDSAIELENRLRTRITREIDLFSMNQGTLGKKYLIEIIYLALKLPKHKDLQIVQLYADVGKIFQKEASAVDVAIRRLVDGAFLRTDPKDLEQLYPPYVDIGRGAPKNKEFVAFIIDKIKKENIY